MHNKGDSFFELYRQVFNWDYNMNEATFKRILSKLLENNNLSTTQENKEEESSSTEKDKSPDMLEMYPESVPDSWTKNADKSRKTANHSAQEKNANKEDIDKNKTDIKKDKLVDSKINNQATNKSPVNKEEKDDSASHPCSDKNNNANDKENVENPNIPKVDDLKSQNITSKDIDTLDYSSSTQENTHLPSNKNVSSTESQSIQAIEDLSKRIDSLTNDIHTILKKIDSMNGAILKLEQKNPNKIINQNADDFIRIYADERKSTSINLNIQLKEHIRQFGKKFNVKTFSDAVNLALLTTLYTYDDSVNTKEK